MNSNKQQTTNNKQLRKGFTLVETLVAIAILLLAIGGPLTIAARSFFAARFSKDNLTAVYLAQEGVELVRQIRENNILSGNDWLNGLGNCLAGQKCYLGFTSTSALLCSGETCPVLRQNQTLQYYTYTTSHPLTIFTREIQITETSDTEVQVVSRVLWQTGNIERQTELTETLHDW